MKATLSFNLTEEQDDFKDAINGTKYKLIIEEILNFIRQKYKYEDQENINSQELREFIVGLLNDD